MTRQLAAVFAMALSVSASVSTRTAQQPDLFSCVVPSRLAAPRSATYAVKGSNADYVDVEEVARIDEPGRQLLRVTRTRYRDNAMTSAQTMQVLASTLAPISYVHSSARTPDAPAAKLAVDGTRLTGLSYGARSVSANTGGQAVLFGNAAEEMLAAAVDWDRCPTVTALNLSVDELDVRREVTMTAAGERTFALDGRQLPVHDIRVTKAGYEYTFAVTKTAPFVVVSASHSTPPSTKTLIKMQ